MQKQHRTDTKKPLQSDQRFEKRLIHNEVIMKKNIHIVNADRLARLIGRAANPRVKSTLVKAWANEIRLACRLAAKRGV